jgi:hypothetical protein
VNPPDAASRTLAVGSGYVDLTGQSRATVTLDAAAGVVLVKAVRNAG